MIMESAVIGKNSLKKNISKTVCNIYMQITNEIPEGFQCTYQTSVFEVL